jgi:hypothetical protein
MIIFMKELLGNNHVALEKNEMRMMGIEVIIPLRKRDSPYLMGLIRFPNDFLAAHSAVFSTVVVIRKHKNKSPVYHLRVLPYAKKNTFI